MMGTRKRLRRSCTGDKRGQKAGCCEQRSTSAKQRTRLPQFRHGADQQSRAGGQAGRKSSGPTIGRAAKSVTTPPKAWKTRYRPLIVPQS